MAKAPGLSPQTTGNIDGAVGDAITFPVNSLSRIPCFLRTAEQHAAAIADDTHRNIRGRTPASIWGSTPSPEERASLKAQGLEPFQPSPGKHGPTLTRASSLVVR